VAPVATITRCMTSAAVRVWLELCAAADAVKIVNTKTTIAARDVLLPTTMPPMEIPAREFYPTAFRGFPARPWIGFLQ
jgi:hypothetical protein